MRKAKIALASLAIILTTPAAAFAARTADPGYVFYETIDGQAVKIIAGYDSRRNNKFCNYYDGLNYSHLNGQFIQAGQVGSSSSSDLEGFCLAKYPDRTAF